MARTVPQHTVHGHVRGDYVAVCQDCGSEYLRRDIVRKRDGLYYCPDCAQGKDQVTLNDEIAVCAARPRPNVPPMDAPPVQNGGVTPPSETLEDALTRVFGR